MPHLRKPCLVQGILPLFSSKSFILLPVPHLDLQFIWDWFLIPCISRGQNPICFLYRYLTYLAPLIENTVLSPPTLWLNFTLPLNFFLAGTLSMLHSCSFLTTHLPFIINTCSLKPVISSLKEKIDTHNFMSKLYIFFNGTSLSERTEHCIINTMIRKQLAPQVLVCAGLELLGWKWWRGHSFWPTFFACFPVLWSPEVEKLPSFFQFPWEPGFCMLISSAHTRLERLKI